MNTNNADIVKVFIDNGTTAGNPSTYDIRCDEHKSNKQFDDWMLERELAGKISRRWTFINISGDKYRLDLTNTSGSSATYRVFNAFFCLPRTIESVTMIEIHNANTSNPRYVNGTIIRE